MRQRRLERLVMRYMNKLYVMCFVTLFLALMDGALTFINTPDLKLEGNPLVSVLGLGWAALFVANLVFCTLYVVGGYFTLIKYQTPKYEVNNIKEFTSQLFYDRTDKFVWILYKMPKNWKPFWASLAYAYLYTAPFGRAILVIEWLMYTFDIDVEAYNQLCDLVPFGRVDVSLGMILYFYLIYHWVVKEYKKNQNYYLETL